MVGFFHFHLSVQGSIHKFPLKGLTTVAFVRRTKSLLCEGFGCEEMNRPNQDPCRDTVDHQEFQVPKMEGFLNRKMRLFWGWVFPYISLTSIQLIFR